MSFGRAPPAESAAREKNGMECAVLIVDDDREFLEVLAERIRNRGCRVDTAASAAEALELVERKEYDAVLLDLMMPGVGGIETLRAMRLKRPEIQVIFLTGHPSLSKGAEALRLGAMDFVAKPVELAEVMEKIEAAGRRRFLAAKRASGPAPSPSKTGR